MTTVFQTPAGDAKLSQTEYRFQADAVAPGMVQIIDELQAPNEAWYSTLERSLQYTDATDEQKTLLLGLTERARQGIAPDPVASKFEAGKLLTWASVCALLLKIF